MTFTFSPVPSCVLGSFTATETDPLPSDYSEAVNLLHDAFLALRIEAINLRQTGGVQAADVAIAKCDAIMCRANDLMDERAEQHAKSAFRLIRCGADWKDCFDISIHADEGIVPKLGQMGQFQISVHGFDYLVVYQPYKFGRTFDHLEFYHYENGQPVKAPCPLTETGYRSAFVHCEKIDFYRTVDAAAQGYILANESVKPETLKQRDLFACL